MESAKTTSSLEVAMTGSLGKGPLDASLDDPLCADPLADLRRECDLFRGIAVERDLGSERRCRDLFDCSSKPKLAHRGSAFCEHDPGSIVGERSELDIVIRADKDGHHLLGT